MVITRCADLYPASPSKLLCLLPISFGDRRFIIYGCGLVAALAADSVEFCRELPAPSEAAD
jgi:hypothetical protein